MNRVTKIQSPRARPHAMLMALMMIVVGPQCRRDEVVHARVAKGRGAMPSMGQATGMDMPPKGREAPPSSGQAPPGDDVPLPPQPGQGEKLAWALPKGWTETKGEGMRYATLQPAVKGKSEVSIIMLPGAVGGELANVNRWRGQIGLPPVDESALPGLRTNVTSKAGRVSLYDFISEDQAKTRMVVGMLATEASSWFLKLQGDTDAVSAARAGFATFLGTLHLE
jgi:hypothetical protein